jgi:uncharacterized MAPEG superfamily protein
MGSVMPTTDMTFPLWGLVIFIVWTIAVVVLLLTVRIRHLSAGGSAKDFATPNDESLLWRLFRAQSNLVENLPLYIGAVFLLTVRGWLLRILWRDLKVITCNRSLNQR